jgi:hypothetical protein
MGGGGGQGVARGGGGGGGTGGEADDVVGGCGRREPGGRDRRAGAHGGRCGSGCRGGSGRGERRGLLGFGAPRPTAADAAAVLALSPPQADLVLDPATGAYTRFDADAGQWLVFDEERRQWRPATAEPTLVALPSSAPRPPLR